MPDKFILDIARNMVKEVEGLGFASDELIFYMGDIAYNKLVRKMKVFYGRSMINNKFFGIEVIRLSSSFNDPGALILESKTPFMDGYSIKMAFNDLYGIPLKYKIKKVIFNDPATIILWKDGTKTVVQTQGEDFDPEKGMAMAIAKKALGNEGNYYDIFKEWLPEEDDEDYFTFDDASKALKKMGEAFRNALKGPTIETTSCISKEAVENITKHHEDSSPKKIDISFDNKKEAERVLRIMKCILEEDGEVTVDSYNYISGKRDKLEPSNELFGWTNLDEARVESAGGNYFIVLPKVVRLGKEYK